MEGYLAQPRFRGEGFVLPQHDVNRLYCLTKEGSTLFEDRVVSVVGGELGGAGEGEGGQTGFGVYNKKSIV